ncbi:hypothetical protein GOV14_03475 [Candidatus Pacearchaeota archaeon]|nr:hypothetical protein [Candidatus Pacearchaeota archaeon]
MPTCSFCKKAYDPHKGLTLFSFDGKTSFFCSSKCQRNAKLKRDPKKTNWVKRPKKEKKSITETVNSSTLKVEEKAKEIVPEKSIDKKDNLPKTENKEVVEKKE